ncbi:MAG: retropepsin-like aspartic protease [Myxococcota bacterium]
MRGRLTSSAGSVFAALGWVLLGLGSLASLVVALWVTASMSRAAGADPQSVLGAAWPWIVAIVVTLGLPFAVAVWRHQGDARRISLTMAWLPMLWNVGGLLLATQVVPDIMANALRTQGAHVAADRLGDSHSATRVMSALGHRAGDLITESTSTVANLDALRPGIQDEASGEIDVSRVLSIPFAEEDTAILVDVTLHGNDASLPLPYLFDTGASFTTISSKTAATLGVEVPADAPTLTFNTASGPRESRMVYLPAIEVGRVRIEGMLVSVCDACVNERTEGLLGLNVMREFIVEMDYKNERMLLLPRISEERPNRAKDIEPVVQLKVEGPAEVWLGMVRWVVLIENRGTVPVKNLVPVVEFTDGPQLVGAEIDEIAPGATGRSLVEGKATLEGSGDSRGHYTLGLTRAYW